MRILESIGTPEWARGFKTVNCGDPFCSRWVTQRQLSVRSFGVAMADAWYCSYRCFATSAELRFSKLLTPDLSTQRSNIRSSLGLTLLRNNLLTDSQYKDALSIQNESSEEIGELVVRLGLLSEKQVTNARAARWACPIFPCFSAVFPCAYIPSRLMSRYAMAPLHYAPMGNRLFVGFAYDVEYGALFAVEQANNISTQPCIVAPSHFHRLIRSQSDALQPNEVVLEGCERAVDMAQALCSYGRSVDASKVAIVRCGEFIWARLKGNQRVSDLLFKLS